MAGGSHSSETFDEGTTARRVARHQSISCYNGASRAAYLAKGCILPSCSLKTRKERPEMSYFLRLVIDNKTIDNMGWLGLSVVFPTPTAEPRIW